MNGTQALRQKSAVAHGDTKLNHATPAQALELELTLDPLENFVRLPGLLRRWEISQVVQSSADYRIEPAGQTDDGTPVFAVYHREHTRLDAEDVGIAVTVSFEKGSPVPAQLLPLNSGDPLMGVLVVSHDPNDDGLLARVREHLVRAAQSMPATTLSTPTAAFLGTPKREAQP
jgi:hypothetical protein